MTFITDKLGTEEDDDEEEGEGEGEGGAEKIVMKAEVNTAIGENEERHMPPHCTSLYCTALCCTVLSDLLQCTLSVHIIEVPYRTRNIALCCCALHYIPRPRQHALTSIPSIQCYLLLCHHLFSTFLYP